MKIRDRIFLTAALLFLCAVLYVSMAIIAEAGITERSWKCGRFVIRADMDIEIAAVHVHPPDWAEYGVPDGESDMRLLSVELTDGTFHNYIVEAGFAVSEKKRHVCLPYT